MRKLTVVGGLAAAALISAAVPRAIFIQTETHRVPVSRLAGNLEAQLKRDPKNVETHINLARLYGMAYALRSEEVPATTMGPDKVERPWYGHADASNIPYRSEPLSAKDRGTPAAEHLKKALEHYEAALALDAANLLALLGHGWALQQAGQRERAIEQYRKVIERAWPKERTAKGRGFQPMVTDEAARYLIPLLDRRRDAEEIKELEARRDQLERLPRAITPIAIPLSHGGDGRTLADSAAIVRFDADGSGLRRDWSWISRDAGWLVYDAEGNGEITTALQWFGNVSFWLFWSNGYRALSALDDDGDGEIAGFELAHLALWHDANQNGVSEPGEVRAVARHGIVAISCRFEESDDERFAAMSRAGVRFRDGRVRPTYDVILREKRGLSTRP